MTNVTRTSPKNTVHTNVFVNPSASGDNQIVAGVTNAKYRVLSVAVVTTLANNVKFRSATTDVSATFPLAANGGFVLPFNEHGWFETASGEALQVNLSVATATGVQIQYIKLTA